MLDILCVGVEDADTFILVLFINCGREEKGAHKLTVRDTRLGVGEGFGGRLSSVPGRIWTHLPRPTHSCLGYRWQGGCQTEPRPLT